jgi:hypothetical protein
MPLASELLMPGRSLKLEYKMLRHGENSFCKLGPGKSEAVVEYFASIMPYSQPGFCIIDVIVAHCKSCSVVPHTSLVQP